MRALPGNLFNSIVYVFHIIISITSSITISVSFFILTIVIDLMSELTQFYPNPLHNVQFLFIKTI